MTQTGKKTRKTAPKRDAYDEFLDAAEVKKPKTAPKKASGASAAGGKSSGTKKSGSTARKKSAQVEPGIVALGAKAPSAAAKKSASGKKPAQKAEAARKTTGKKTSVQKPAAKTDSPAKKSGRKPAAKPVEAGIQRKTANTDARPEPHRARTQPAQRRANASDAQGAKKKTAQNRPANPAKRSAAARKKPAVLYVANDGGRDAYDDYLEVVEPKRPRKSSKKRKKGGGATAMLLAAILCIVGLGVWQQTRYWSFQQMKAAVERQTFYEGTTVEGIDISSMTLQQALDHWANDIEPKYFQRAVTLSNGMMYTSGELGYTSDYADVLRNAWGAGRSGSLEERYRMISNRQNAPVEYTVTRQPYTEAGIDSCVESIAAQINEPAQDAHIESFDMENYAFVFADGKAGREVDTEALRSGMAQALDAGGGAVELVVNEIQPSTKKEEIASRYGMITSAVTNASSSSSNRLTNIKQSLKLINGTCLAPGETFSFNETVGKRTTERGFKVATAYAGGEVTEEVGGGICQVSTTLFNAAVKADLEIVERHNHSLTVGYVDKGKDAAVNWNSQDLRFKNTTDDDLYICCYLNDKKRVLVGIFGKLLENGETITVEGETTGTIDYETTYQLNFEMLPGQTRVLREGKNGYTASAYKIRWDANGNQISRELLCKSRYKAVNAIIEHGP